MTIPWAEELAAALGPDARLSFDADVVASQARDQAPLAPAGTAVALVRARSEADVVATLRIANARKIPVVTRGAGTGLAGGANAVDGCIVLSVLAMDRILRIDEPTRTAVVEPGVLNAVLAREVATRGLYYAPDPASREISTIGGNIATNAGGSCCLKYGVTGDHVAALRVVLADGTIVRTGSVTAKNVAGLDLTRIIVGSEGTLGVVTEATVRLRRAPREASTLVAFFSSVNDAANAIVEMEKELDLSLIEVMDRTTLVAVEKMTAMGLDTEAAAFVLVQSDAEASPAMIERASAISRSYAARDVMATTDAEEGQQLLTARRMALPALERLGTTLLDDVAVPKPALPTMFARIDEVARKHSLVIGTFGHAGDGNLHPTIVWQPGDPKTEVAARAAFQEIVLTAMELGGTIAGEHGVGSLKQRYMQRMVGDAERALMLRIKLAFDPNGIMNPGKAI